ncbi:hypothetical protein RP20_CCG008019 [Aedes albopictus]|nr:hypothetical protein RP20_CCG008019 [Aedes albopictus]
MGGRLHYRETGTESQRVSCHNTHHSPMHPGMPPRKMITPSQLPSSNDSKKQHKLQMSSGWN